MEKMVGRGPSLLVRASQLLPPLLVSTPRGASLTRLNPERSRTCLNGLIGWTSEDAEQGEPPDNECTSDT